MRAERHVPTFDPIDVTADDAARMVRAQWRVPVGPVHSVAAWLDAAGVFVVERDLGPASRVDGLSQWVGAYPVMLVNTSAPTDRKRLTLAHELGHLVLHATYVEAEAEDQANRFAAEFLMPADEIRPMLRARISLDRLVELKRYWGVSMRALIERAYYLEAVTAAQRTSLYKAMSARGMRTHEPLSDELTPERANLTEHIMAALTARGLGLAEIAELAGYATPADAGLTSRRLQLV